jgi:hypothetical protein
MWLKFGMEGLRVVSTICQFRENPSSGSDKLVKEVNEMLPAFSTFFV